MKMDNLHPQNHVQLFFILFMTGGPFSLSLIVGTGSSLKWLQHGTAGQPRPPVLFQFGLHDMACLWKEFRRAF
jgi:hypothetical protein